MKNLSFLFIMAVTLLLSCKKDDDNGNGVTPSNNTSNIVFITSNIDQVTTWYADSIYVIKAYDFYINNTLTIQAGTVIKFHPTAGPYAMLGGSGTIVANGTVDKPIIFTSFKDDAHGGDSNSDGNATTPAPKDWGYINTNGLNSSIFNYCEFYYGGNSTYNATLTLYGDNIQVTNCKFSSNDGSYTSSAGDIGVLDATDAGTGTIIQNNIFYNNKRPLSISTAFDMDNSNIFHNPDNLAQTNQYNGIFVETIDEITAPRTWQETEVAFVIDDNDWYIQTGATLTLGSGVVLKFKTNSVLALDDGLTSINNYNGTNVFFTSYKDDTKKGDTNGDGATTSPQGNDWGGIYNNSTSLYESWGNILYDSH